MAGTCPTEPTVTNSKAAVLTNKTETIIAYYECLTGFSMSGNQTIVCNKTLGLWPSPPACSVIESNVYVYSSNDTSVDGDSWWTYFLAVFLVALLLILLSFLIWCCCWAPRTDNGCCSRCCCRRRSNTMPMNNGLYRDSIFWHYQHPNQGKGHDEGVRRNGRNGMAITGRDSGQVQGRGQGHNKQTTPTAVSGSNTNNSVAPVEADRDGSVSTGKTPREAPVYRTPKPAKDPAKEAKMWMPHANNVRDINTSTK